MKKTKLRNYYNSYETYHFQGPKTEFYKKEKMRNVIYVSNKKNQKKNEKKINFVKLRNLLPNPLIIELLIKFSTKLILSILKVRAESPKSVISN